MLVRMNVAGMIFEDNDKMFHLLLKETDGEIIVSIQIDRFQAESISIAMESPFTRISDPYNFISNILDAFELRIAKVIIKNRKYFTKNAEVYITDGERNIRVDAHAGDAIASALPVGAPIFIKSDFLGRTYKKELKKWLESVKPGDFG